MKYLDSQGQNKLVLTDITDPKSPDLSLKNHPRQQTSPWTS